MLSFHGNKESECSAFGVLQIQKPAPTFDSVLWGSEAHDLSLFSHLNLIIIYKVNDLGNVVYSGTY